MKKPKYIPTKFLRLPPPVDNAFVAPGCEKFGKAKKRAPNAPGEPLPPEQDSKRH